MATTGTYGSQAEKCGRALTDGERAELKDLFCHRDHVDSGAIDRFEDLRSRATSADYIALTDDPEIARTMARANPDPESHCRRLPSQNNVTLACLIGMTMAVALLLGVWP